ncbi:MAG: hypothetical protein WED82_13325 [Balneolales bacterium]
MFEPESEGDKYMLTNDEAEHLLEALKELKSDRTIDFPEAGGNLQLEASTTVNGKEHFLIDVNRKGSIKIKKATYQTRYLKYIPLLRLDINGPSHTNPDLEEIPCPHIHIYREGHDDKWAYPLPKNFSNPDDLIQTLKEFLMYNNIKDIPYIQEGGLV